MSVPKNYITSGISKTFLTPCRRVGLSRSKKTPKNIIASPLTPTPNSLVNISSKHVEAHLDVSKKNTEFEETPKRHSPRHPKKSLKKITPDSVGNKSVKANESSEITVTELDSYNVHIKENATLANKEKYTLKDSPDQSVASSRIVIADVHHPVAKRSINFSMPDNLADKPSIMSSTKEQSIIKDSTAPAEEKNYPSFPQIEDKSVIKIKKRKLRLDSDDFSNAGDEILPENNHLTATKSSDCKINKQSLKTCNESNSRITLGRFTTEDYLKDYSSNPEKFQKNMKECGSVSDDEAFSSPLISVKNKKIKSNNDFSKKYVAILCPTIDQSIAEVKPKRSLSTKKYSLDLKKPTKEVIKMEKSNLERELTVDLERLTKEDFKKNLKRDDNKIIQLEELPLNLEHSKSKISYLKSNNFDDDDDGLFTSSPENDKKQRESLLQLIVSIESEIKQKREKLETLMQAQVYKNKHSPQKLRTSSDRWLEGCRAGLNALLVKMEEHGPMDMDTLTKKLRIPDDILEKLQL